VRLVPSDKALGLTLAAFGLGLFGCHGDPEDSKIQYVPDMADAPTVKTLREYLDAPQGSVAMNVGLYPKTPEEAEKQLTMPPSVAGDAQALAAGKKLFETYCAVCHGLDAKGKGTIKHPAIAPPDLTHPTYLGRADGFFFYRITFGTAVMPAYGHATDPVERWKIIRHLRTLQKATP
jgi:mono/diheme cytochrome c family protein